MRAYLAITGMIFALLAVFHLRQIIADWSGFDAGLWTLLTTMFLCAALAWWAYRLFTHLNRQA
ncbi:MAG TPA: hypothetical protein VMU22_06450 [Rhizomicrobium sp.]|nr:hypothetical protein [Rhizomicrobium sp.]